MSKDLRKEFNDKVLGAANELVERLKEKIPAMRTDEQTKLLGTLTKAMDKKPSDGESADTQRTVDARTQGIRNRLGIDN